MLNWTWQKIMAKIRLFIKKMFNFKANKEIWLRFGYGVSGKISSDNVREYTII